MSGGREAKRVEFRWLQFFVSHVSNAQLTVGLLHWDGMTLRYAFNAGPFDLCEPAQRAALWQTLRDIEREVGQVAADLGGRGRAPEVGLKALFSVREGVGASLYWAPVETSSTVDAAAHFASLRGSLRLDETQSPPHVTAETLRAELVSLAEHLHEAHPTRVFAEREVRRHYAYRAPLSWVNGKWHHAVPLSLDGKTRRQREREVERLIGLFELALPRGDVPVVVAAFGARRPRPHDRRADEEAHVRRLLEERNVRLMVASRGEGVDLQSLAELVNADVGATIKAS
jgi:hypothetical protein